MSYSSLAIISDESLLEEQFFSSVIYRRKLEKYARNFSGLYDINLFFGSTSKTNGKVITLNSTGNLAIDFLDRIRLDKTTVIHECGHILFTDFNLITKFRQFRPAEQKMIHMLWNCLEDRYIEKKISENFRGVRADIFWSNRVLLSFYKFSESESSVQQFFKLFIAYCVSYVDLTDKEFVSDESKQWFYQAIPLVKELEEMVDYGTSENIDFAIKIFDIFPKEKRQENVTTPDTRNEEINSYQVGEKPEEILEEIPNFNSSKKELEKKESKLDSENDSDKENSNEELEEESENESTTGSKNESEEDSEEDSEEESGNESGNESDLDNGSIDESEEESEDESEEESEEESEDESEDGSTTGSKNESEEESGNESGNESDSDNGSIDESEEDDLSVDGIGSKSELLKEFSDALVLENKTWQQILSHVANIAPKDSCSDALITVEFNPVNHEDRESFAEVNTTILHANGIAVRSLSKKFRSLTDEERGELRNQRSGGSIRSVWKTDGKVFIKRKIVEDIPRPSITILVDQSGSMGRIKYQVLQTLVVFQEFCLKEEIPLAILGHTALSGENKVKIFGIKMFEEKNVPIWFQPMENTREGISLAWCKEYILRHRFEKNWLFVISDGEPYHVGLSKEIYAGDIACNDVIREEKKLRASGIHPIGIGLGVDISHLYRHSICINEIGDLSNTLFTLVKRIMMM